MKYTTSIESIFNIENTTRKEMVRLYLTTYDGSDEILFNSDLADKDEALLVYAEDRLVGFTTFKVYDRIWDGNPIRVLYSGDTIIDREHWGQQALAFAWIQRMGEIKRLFPERTFYWFLLVKGHRTFKYMPVFGKTFFPHWSEGRSDLKPLADKLASEKFGSDYNAETGVVEFPISRGHLKPEIANPSPEELAKESVQFFLQRNPSYKRGHELVCICEMEEQNMKPLTKRLFRKSSRESLCVE